MKRLWQRLTGRQRLLAAVAAVLAIMLAGKYFGGSLPMDDLPLPKNIAYQERELRRSRGELGELLEQRQALDARLAELRQKAASFWQIEGRAPQVEVPAEFSRLARQAQVNPQQVGAPRVNKVMDLAHVREVEFSIRLSASMREVSRLVAQMDGAPHAFYWSRCNIRPDNIRSPKGVVLNGRIVALVLSADACRFLAENGSGHE